MIGEAAVRAGELLVAPPWPKFTDTCATVRIWHTETHGYLQTTEKWLRTCVSSFTKDVANRGTKQITRKEAQDLIGEAAVKLGEAYGNINR